ncbi:MAG TPA: tetratricopeptide repeat protein [Burkholderiales bacterium]|nr:tetratricopeptide repeat protein [Burkholderiales bacterium]
MPGVDSLRLPSLDERFAQLMAQADSGLDVLEAALLIAKNIYGDLDVDAYRARLEAMAQCLRDQLDSDASGAERIVALNRFLFEDQGFRPNIDDYYDPRNSFLNEVLDRRVGIPISLSIVYMEVGRRIGLSLEGVSFPGHFLVKCPLEQGLVVLDPYSGGASLTMKDLQERLRDLQAGEVSRNAVPNYLVTAKRHEIVARMLRNLKSIYLQRQDYLRALPFIHWMILASPDNAEAVRERGMAYMKLECFRAALTDFERYLELAPAANDSEEIRGHVVDLRRSAARLN